MKKLVVRSLLSSLLILSGSLGTPAGALAQVPQKSPPPMKLSEPLPANAFSELSRIINPTIVNISTSILPRGNMRMRDPMLDLLERFYGGGQGVPQQPKGPQKFGLGTGFIIRDDGLILTNNHVIENADIINVQLTEGAKTYEATVIGSDKRTDIALIKITPTEKLPVAALGSSKDVQVGEWVAAFGNPFGHGHSMSKGIISSKGREIGEINKIPLLQTDASINPGNSGGPLVNTKGYVIGVNSAIDARAQGIGFAIPIDEVKALIPQLESRGSIQRGYIGAALADLDPQAAAYMGLPEDQPGAVIANLEKSGPGAKAGLKPYDIVVEFNGRKIRNSTDLVDAISDAPINKEAKAKVLRGDRNIVATIMIKERPEDKKTPHAAPKKVTGQKLPYDLGFSVVDATDEVKAQWGYPPELKQPIIIEVDRNGPASRSGLRVGDVVLDVNKKSVDNAKDVLKHAKKSDNILRIARGGQIAIVTLDGKP